jgi:hypothetical protein
LKPAKTPRIWHFERAGYQVKVLFIGGARPDCGFCFSNQIRNGADENNFWGVARDNGNGNSHESTFKHIVCAEGRFAPAAQLGAQVTYGLLDKINVAVVMHKTPPH